MKGEEERGSWSPDLVIIFFSAVETPPTHNNNFRPISRDWDIQSKNFKNKNHLLGLYIGIVFVLVLFVIVVIGFVVNIRKVSLDMLHIK